MINVFLVDDHDILLDGIAAILSESKLIAVTGMANNAELAEHYIKAQKPDVVITDISLPGRSGIELTAQLKKIYPEVKIIALSMHDEMSYISNMIKAGASGYLLKTVKNKELISAICQVYEGKTYIQQSLSKSFANYRQNTANNPGVKILSPREIEIIRLVVQDLSTAEISKKLFISVYTVETHRKNIWRKTGVKSLVSLINYAQEHNLI